MGYSREEMETCLIYEAETDTWQVYSCYPSHITKILKIVNEKDVEFETEEGRESPLSIKCTLKSNQISFRTGKKREMSEEQKQKARERLAKARSKS